MLNNTEGAKIPIPEYISIESSGEIALSDKIMEWIVVKHVTNFKSQFQVISWKGNVSRGLHMHVSNPPSPLPNPLLQLYQIIVYK